MRETFVAYGCVLCVVLVSVPMVQPWRAYAKGDRIEWSWRTWTMHRLPADTTAAAIDKKTVDVRASAPTSSTADTVALLTDAPDAADGDLDPDLDPDPDPDDDGKTDKRDSSSSSAAAAQPAAVEPFEVEEGPAELDGADGDRATLRPPPLKERTFWQQLRSVEFAVLTVFVVALLTSMQFYVATVSAQTQLLGDSEASGYVYVKAFTVAGAVGFVAFPLISYTLERRGFAVSYAVVAVLMALHSVTALIPVLEVQYLTFAFWSTGRFCLFAVYFAYLPEIFGFRYFGTLNGVLSVFMALSALLPYPLTLLVLGPLAGQYWPLNTAFLVLTAVAGIAYPLWLYRRHRRHGGPA